MTGDATAIQTIEVPRPGETPEACIARIAGLGDFATTPCGDGEMVWRIFGDGPPLLLCHGGFGRWTHWIRNVEFLSRHFKLYVPDLPGHGDSAVPPEPFSGQGVAAVVAAGMDALLPAGQRYHIAGFSFGGIIGGCVAGAQGDRVETLTICGSNGLGLIRGEVTGLCHWRGVDDPVEIAAIHRNNLSKVMFGNPDNIDDLAVHMQTVNVVDARVKGRLVAVTNVLAEMLPKVSARLAGIWGGADCYARDYMDERRALFHAAQLKAPFHVIDGAGHWMIYETPAEFHTVFLQSMAERG